MRAFLDTLDNACKKIEEWMLAFGVIFITIITTGKTGGYEVRGFEKKTALPSTSKGWYIDLPDKGERIVLDDKARAAEMKRADEIIASECKK